jgi:hypothetical protein
MNLYEESWTDLSLQTDLNSSQSHATTDGQSVLK